MRPGRFCRVLREQGCQIAVRTYRSWLTRGASERTISDAHVVDAVRAVAWNTRADGTRKLAAEGLYGHRKMVCQRT